MRARFSVHPSRSLGPVRTPRARELQNALRTQDAKRRAAKPTPIKMPRRSNSFFRGVPPRHLFKASPHNSPHTSWRPICPTNALQNLVIRKVFLRFCALLRHKFSRRSARAESCGNALTRKRLAPQPDSRTAGPVRARSARHERAGTHGAQRDGAPRPQEQKRWFPMTLMRGRLQIQALVAVLGLK